jgi:hypothetical protein
MIAIYILVVAMHSVYVPVDSFATSAQCEQAAAEMRKAVTTAILKCERKIP